METNQTNQTNPDKPDYMTLGWVKEQTIKNLNEKGDCKKRKNFLWVILVESGRELK